MDAIFKMSLSSIRSSTQELFCRKIGQRTVEPKAEGPSPFMAKVKHGLLLTTYYDFCPTGCVDLIGWPMNTSGIEKKQLNFNAQFTPGLVIDAAA